MVVIIDYKMGNVASVEKALMKLGAEVLLSGKEEDINQASHLILPGVGSFGDGMKNLEREGLIEILNREVLEKNKPFLGICLGMQLLAEEGHEFGRHKGLGFLKGETVKLEVPQTLRLPHVGWNEVKASEKESLFEGVRDFNFYFVHSYYLDCREKEAVVATCRYGQEFPAAIHKENIFATQFHPEKSQDSGLKLLENFLHYS